MPRWIEVPLALFGLIAMSPLLVAIAILVMLSSKGPVLFSQKRVGLGGRLFSILKFRTMVVEAESRGLKLTCGGHDPRVTGVGYWLRQFKLDELPQLWNVVLGDMKFVGPRPEVPEYVKHWDESQRAMLLSVPPGITDPASIEFRDENELLACADDAERLYLEELMPRKLDMNIRYLKRRTAFTDCVIIASTVRRGVMRV